MINAGLAGNYIFKHDTAKSHVGKYCPNKNNQVWLGAPNFPTVFARLFTVLTPTTYSAH